MAPRTILKTTLALFVLTFAAGFLRGEDAALLVSSSELHSGGRSAATVTTFDLETRRPVSRSTSLSLLDGANVVSVIHTGTTGDNGRVEIPYDVPDLGSGAYTLKLEVEGIAEALSLDVTISRAPAILIETDKPIYKPLQTILGRIVLINNQLQPASGEVELSFHDAKGIRIDRRSLTANEFGVAPFELDLASEVNFGTWRIRARSEGVETVRDVRVEDYVLPRFELALGFERNWALVDEEVNASVTARYFFGKDVNGDVRVSARRWVGVWEEYANLTGTLDDGAFAFTLPAVGFVAATPGSSAEGDVRIDLEVTDATGHTQSATELLRIVESSVVLGLVPRARTLKPEMALPVLLTAKSPAGEPLDQEVSLSATFLGSFGETLGHVQQSVAVSSGLGSIELTPPPQTSYAELEARAQRDGRWTTVQARVGSAYSPGGSYLSLARSGADGPVAVGELASFSAISTHPGTVFFEVYAGGRTVLSDATETEDFSFAVTSEMIPKARVVAYKINPDNEVVADSVSLEVKLESSITIEAVFAPEEVKPGDVIELSIDAGTGQRTLIGLSIVDESVLALGRGRLEFAEVFAELERRFLRPQVEVHDDGGGPEPGPLADVAFDAPFFGPPRNFGALDTLREIGLDIAASANITVPEGGFLDWAILEDVDAVPGAERDEGAGSAPDGVRVREYFPETWVWEPVLLTDDAGLATLSLTVPDSITRWQLTAIGSSQAGLGLGETELTVFQDFFVEPSLPSSVTRGEEFTIQVDVFNYLENAQEVTLSLGSASWFELLGQSELRVTVPPDAASSVDFPIRPLELGDQPVQLTAIGSQAADAVRRNLRVVPEGVPTESVLNSVIEAGQTVPLDVSVPTEAVEGSARAFLHVTPSPVGQTLEGVSELLEMPFGCGEQNMIFLAPDIEVLKYLREINELDPEIRAEAEYLVNVGYQRQLTYQTTDGGFAAFGGDDGSLWLTAFVLSTFSGAREVREIDENVLSRAADMLVSRRRVDGSFQTDDFLIHKEMDGGLENIYAMTAYVTNALADYAAGGTGTNEVLETLAAAALYLADTRSAVNDDAYSLSIAAVALEKVTGFETVAESIVDRLVELAISEGVGIHWQPYPVETSGYATMALLGANGGAGRPEAAAAVDWLSTQRNSLGGYGGSTQDTVVAIRALFQAARKVRRDLDLNLTLRHGEDTLLSVAINEGNFDVLQTFDLPLPEPPGSQAPPLSLEASGSGSTGYQVVRRYNVPGSTLPPPRNMLITVDYDTEGIEVDTILDVRVRLNYTGFKEATGMVIADIGIPTGFAALRSTLEALVDAELVSRFEIAGRKVIFYIDSLRRLEPLEFSFQMRALYPVRAEGPVSSAYEYYDPDVIAHDQIGAISVKEAVPARPFLRGDGNADGTVNIADPSFIVNFVFRGGPLPCYDAGDANDDSRIDIADPIYVFQWKFFGERPPPAPFPECGLDPTVDALRCESFPPCN